MSDAKHSTADYPSTSMPGAVGHVYIRIYIHLFYTVSGKLAWWAIGLFLEVIPTPEPASND